MYGLNAGMIEVPLKEYRELLLLKGRVEAALDYAGTGEFWERKVFLLLLTGEKPEQPDREEETE